MTGDYEDRSFQCRGFGMAHILPWGHGYWKDVNMTLRPLQGGRFDCASPAARPKMKYCGPSDAASTESETRGLPGKPPWLNRATTGA
jgi:hypothetical protein